MSRNDVKGTMGTEKTYSIKELADLAGVSARTLRHYDQLGLLVPRRASNGYRVYGADDVRTLQYILVLRQCRMPLAAIAEALHEPDFQLNRMLASHLTSLRRQRLELDETIATVQRAIGGLERFMAMDDKQRFEQLKRESVEQFEAEYGQESRSLYGDAAIDAANERVLGMSKAAWDAKEELEQRIKDNLKVAMATGDPQSEASRLVAGMHAQWIRAHWGESAYTPEAHRNLAEGYLADPRFIAYYDEACGEGASRFLRDLIVANVQ